MLPLGLNFSNNKAWPQTECQNVSTFKDCNYTTLSCYIYIVSNVMLFFLLVDLKSKTYHLIGQST